MSDSEYSNGTVGGPFGGGLSHRANVTFGDGDTGPEASDNSVRDISTAEFMTEVIEASASRPVIVDFWAPWCGPCKQLAPILEKAVLEANGAVRLVKMNIDDHPEVAVQMGIQSIPAVVAFVDGKPADAFMGVQPESEIRKFIEKLAGSSGPSEIDIALEKAAELVAQNADAEAANIYAMILQQQPTNAIAIEGIGQLYLKSGNIAGARALLDQAPQEVQDAPELASLKSAIELLEQAADLGPINELAQTVENNPEDHQARFDLAVALNGASKRDDAADQLLEIIRRKPGWNDDAAKTQLLQFFEAWGISDDATVAARRKLSSLLFS